MQEYFDQIVQRYPWATEETLRALNEDLTTQNITMASIGAILGETPAPEVKKVARKAEEAKEKAKTIEQKVEGAAKKAQGVMGTLMNATSPAQAIADLSHETAKLMYNAGAAAGDFIGGGGNKVGKAVSFVGKGALYATVAATGIGTVFAKLLAEQEKYARQLIDFGSIVSDIDMYTTLRSSIRSLGMGFKEYADITAATQPFIIASEGDLFKGQFALSKFIAGIERDQSFSDFGLGIQDTARALAEEAEVLYQLGQVTELNAMTKKRVMDSFDAANNLAMFTGNTLGTQRMEALRLREQARNNEDFQFNLIQNAKAIEEQLGEGAIKNITDAVGFMAILNQGTFGDEFMTQFSEDVSRTTGDLPYDKSAANNITPEFLEKLRRVGPGVAEAYIKLVEDTSLGEIKDEKSAVDQQRDFVKLVREQLAKIGTDPNLADSNLMIASAKLVPESYMQADTDELLTSKFYRSLIDNADGSIDTLDDFAVSFQNMQEILTPGFGSMDTGLNMLTGNLMRFGKAVSGFFGAETDFEAMHAKYSAENIKGAVAQVSEKNIDITVQVAREHIDRLTAQRENQQKFIDNPSYVLEDGTEVEATEEQVQAAEAQAKLVEQQLLEQKAFLTALLKKKAELDEQKQNEGVQ